MSRGRVTDESFESRLVVASAARSGRRRSHDHLAPLRSPSVWHVSAIPGDFAGREAIASTLELVAYELQPLVATFFTIDDGGEIDSAIAHGSHLSPVHLAQEVRSWEIRLRGVDPLAAPKLARMPGRIATLRDVGGMQRAVLDKGWVRGTYEQIGAINDVRMLIRDGERLIGGVSLWRRLQDELWSDAQLRQLAALQPLAELAYLSCVRTASSIDARLPGSLTPRQREVARLMARGATTPDVARALFISPETAKSHTHQVLTKLGVSSRRDLVQRLQQASAALGPPLSGELPGTLPRSRSGHRERPLWLEGDEAPRQLLEPVLEWSSERIDATVGGCAFFSARLELTGEAWGGDPAARRVHTQLLSEPGSQLVARLDADAGRAPVVQLDETGPHGVVGRVAELTSGLEMTTPLLAVLRRQGRLAGLVWVCCNARARPDHRESARELRHIHPLLELSHIERATDRSGRTSVMDEFSRHGLSDREGAVAQMALDGLSNAEIARRLEITESTVKKHMTRVLVRFSVRSRTQLMALLGDGSQGG